MMNNLKYILPVLSTILIGCDGDQQQYDQHQHLLDLNLPRPAMESGVSVVRVKIDGNKYLIAKTFRGVSIVAETE